MRTLKLALASVVALAVAGCGNQADFANKPRPASPIVVGAAISDRGVSLTPTRIGAGLIMLVVANQSASSHELSVTPQRGGAPLVSSGPINPQDTATVLLSLAQGTYRVHAASDGGPTANLVVGPPRPSAQNRLLLP